MAQVPRHEEVMKAIRSLTRQTRLATKEANQMAAERLARGDYAERTSRLSTWPRRSRRSATRSWG